MTQLISATFYKICFTGALIMMAAINHSAFCIKHAQVQHYSLQQDETHKVKPGETLTSIAKRYGVTVADLLKWNPEAAQLKAGQVIIVKKGKEAAHEAELPADEKAGMHTVKPGETLSAIARKYGVTVSQLQQWNNLKGVNIAAGQELIVKAGSNTPEKSISNNPNPVISGAQVNSKPSVHQKNNYLVHTVTAGQTLSAISRLYGVSVNEIKQLNELKSDVVQPGMQLQIPTPTVVPEPAATEVKNTTPPPVENARPETPTAVVNNTSEEATKNVSNTMGYTRVVETGFAEVIEDGGNNKKHLCLHRTAPVGSIVQVKNEMNGVTVFVRVIGKLPETGPNEKLLVRLSKRAFESLSPASKRVPVEVSYPAPITE